MKRQELFRRMRKSKTFLIGAISTGAILLLLFLAPVICYHDPIHVTLMDRLTPPQWFSAGAEGYILGTDGVGQDIFARLLYGGRTSVIVAIFGVIFPAVLGTVLGLISGYYGGKVDMFIMRLSDVMLSLPLIMVAITVMAILGANVVNLVIVITFCQWVNYARIARGEVLAMRRSEFVQASIVLGATDRHIIFTQILPNCMTPLIITASQALGFIIILEAGLSFLGCGVPPPAPSWGSMISEGREYITFAPWTVLVPGLSLMFTVLAVNFLGDGVRDVLDPKSKD